MAGLQAPADAYHQSEHHHLSRQPIGLREMPDEGALLSAHTATKDRAQYSRIRARRRSQYCEDRGLPAIAQGSKEGRDAVRTPQADPEAESVALAWTQRSSRRIPLGSGCADSTTNGEVAGVSTRRRKFDTGMSTNRRST